MKGINLVKMVLSLTDEEYHHVYQTLPSAGGDERLRKLLNAIRETKTVSRGRLSALTGIQERTISQLLHRLSHEVTFALAHHQPDKSLELELMLAAAWKLVFRIENDPATDLMQELYDRATSHERFDILLELHKLVEIMTEPTQLKGMDKAEITRRHLNLLQYLALKNRVADLKLLREKERIKAMSEMEQEELLQDEKQALSVSARAHYFWIWTRLYHLGEDWGAALQSQAEVVRLLEENHWLDRFDDFFFAHEHRPLITLMVANSMPERAYQYLFKVGNTSPEHSLTEISKWEQIYPLRIALAIDIGDEEMGLECVEEITNLFYRENINFAARYVTHNLYFISYFYFTIGDFEVANKYNLRLQTRYQRSEYHPAVWPMVRIMAALIAYESGDWEELGRQDKNFRMTNVYRQASYYKFVLGTLKELANTSSSIDKRQILEQRIRIFPETLNCSHSKAANRKFNFSVWMKSRLNSITMAGFFRTQTAATLEYPDSEAI